jgi:hypothetical protein
MSDSDGGGSDADGGERDRTQRLIRAGLVVVLVIGLVVFADLILGLGFVGDGADGTDTGTATATPVPPLSSPPGGDEETATPGIESGDTPGAEASTGTDEPTPTTAPGVTVRGDTRQFQFDVRSFEACGQTCRDVDVELTNSGAAAADVTATSRLYAGEAGEDRVWQGTETIGGMSAGETVERTIRIQLSFVEASKVCGADTVTLVTDVASAEHRQQFTSHPEIDC